MLLIDDTHEPKADRGEHRRFGPVHYLDMRLNAMKKGLAGDNVGLSKQPAPGGPDMLYAGLDLSRQRLDVHVLDE
ncbi:MAG TPA: hypothetical protein VGQ89_15510, partial [Candidatus Limnocylindrales bacterium]|nr:hypothetical protein [Candidatus Limnocylindrales bacterium]